jgi:hypothetical protein
MYIPEYQNPEEQKIDLDTSPGEIRGDNYR